MQRVDTVPSAYCATLLQAVFVGAPLVSEAYSVPEHPLRSFKTPKDLEQYIQGSEASYFTLALPYPETSGVVRRVRFALQPEKCNGATWREKLDGWGLVQLQLKYKEGTVECHVTVNSEKRAHAWAQTLPELGDPSLWQWRLVERHARRLIRVLRNGV